jgi:hypothetical protein
MYCSRCPSRACTHAKRRTSNDCTHCMLTSSFLMLTATSFILCISCSRVSSFPLKYTLDFMQPHTKKSNGDRSGDRGGHRTGPTLPEHWPAKCSLSNAVTSLVVWGGVKSCCIHRWHRIPSGASSKCMDRWLQKLPVRRSCEMTLEEMWPNQITAWQSTPHIYRIPCW